MDSGFVTGLIVGQNRASDTISDWKRHAATLKREKTAGWSAVWAVVDALRHLPTEARCAILTTLDIHLHHEMVRAYSGQGLTQAEAEKSANFIMKQLRQSWSETAALVDRQSPPTPRRQF